LTRWVDRVTVEERRDRDARRTSSWLTGLLVRFSRWIGRERATAEVERELLGA
jgi:hypothetical protein